MYSIIQTQRIDNLGFNVPRSSHIAPKFQKMMKKSNNNAHISSNYGGIPPHSIPYTKIPNH